MKSKKSQEAESLVPLSSQEDTGGEPSLRHDEESEVRAPLPQEALPDTWRARFRSLFRRYWQITLLFAITWLTGAFFICSRLQEPIRLRIMEQFSNFSLEADFPFSFQDPEKLQA